MTLQFLRNHFLVWSFRSDLTTFCHHFHVGYSSLNKFLLSSGAIEQFEFTFYFIILIYLLTLLILSDTPEHVETWRTLALEDELSELKERNAVLTDDLIARNDALEKLVRFEHLPDLPNLPLLCCFTWF